LQCYRLSYTLMHCHVYRYQAGRLPYTVPTGLEQLPPFEDYQMDRGSCGEAACGRT
jgi:hypothetical protein